MRRRAFLGKLGGGLLGGGALLLTSGHTPYGQWVVYRKRTLLIGSCRSDPPTFELGERIAAILAEFLPKSRARLSRAPNYERLASLLGTAQLNVAVLARDRAKAMSRGRAPFEAFDPVALRLLFDMGDYVLACRADFPKRHAFLVSRTLDEEATSIGRAIPEGSVGDSVPPHPGTLAYAEGAPIPPPPTETAPVDRSHSHAE